MEEIQNVLTTILSNLQGELLLEMLHLFETTWEFMKERTKLQTYIAQNRI
jgi:hypothetical protein